MSLLQMSVAAGLLIVVIIALRAMLLNQLPKKTFLILWAVVILRLVLPISFESSMAFGSFLWQPPVDGVIRETLGPTHPTEWLPFTQQMPAVGNAIPESSGERPTLVAEVHLFDGWMTLYLLGVALSISGFVTIYWTSHRKIRRSIPLAHQQILGDSLLNDFKRPLQICVSDEIISPLTTGVLKPKIVLPKDFTFMSEDDQFAILTHELYHIKRFDAGWKIIVIAVLCLHWFNPLVWLMCFFINRDLELTCDEAVIKKLGTTKKKSYAHALVNRVEKQGQLIPFYSGFAKHAVKERIESIMKMKKLSWIASAMSVLTIGGLSYAVFASPAQATGALPGTESVEMLPEIEPASTVELERASLVGELYATARIATPTVFEGNVMSWTYGNSDLPQPGVQHLSREAVLAIVETALDDQGFNDFTKVLVDFFNYSGMNIAPESYRDPYWAIHLFGDTGLSIMDFNPNDPLVSMLADAELMALAAEGLATEPLDPTNHHLFSFFIDASTGEILRFETVDPIYLSNSRASFLELIHSEFVTPGDGNER